MLEAVLLDSLVNSDPSNEFEKILTDKNIGEIRALRRPAKLVEARLAELQTEIAEIQAHIKVEQQLRNYEMVQTSS